MSSPSLRTKTRARALLRSVVAASVLASLVACQTARAPDAAAPPPAAAAKETKAAPPRLVVWLTVDQLSSDTLVRFERHLHDGGLARLLNEGLHFSEAAYEHAITETAPGHATLFTGAPPSVHGIVGNEWFDRASKELVVSVADENALLVAPGLAAPQRENPSLGRSPEKLRVLTVGDVLHAKTEGRARVFSISTKDRGAILPGGHAGKAFWLGAEGFLTSRYYYQEPPEWLAVHAREEPAARWLERSWELEHDASDYAAPDLVAPYRVTELGERFPHRAEKGTALDRVLKYSPFGDEAVLSLARRVIVAEKLGEDVTPDLLALSLSSTDYVSHQYGPESREAEDTFIRLGKQLESFLGFLEERFDDREFVVVLSADHGGSEGAETLRARGLPGKRLTRKALEAALRAAFKKQFGEAELVAAVVTPTVYLNRPRIAQKHLDEARVLAVAQSALSKLDGVFAVFPTATLDVATQPKESAELAQRVLDSIDRERSGDLYVVPQERTLFLQEDELGATHGSPWPYDRRVPVVLWGGSLPKGRVTRAVSVESLAPTVARLLGVAPPLTSRRAALDEAFAR